jgi:hypothetical protein
VAAGGGETRRGDIQKARAEGESRGPSAAKRDDGQRLGSGRMRLYQGTREAMAGGGFGGFGRQPVKGRDAEHGRPCWGWRVRHLPACNKCYASSTRFRRRRHDTTPAAACCPPLFAPVLCLCISAPPPFHPPLSAPPSAPSLAEPVRATRPDLQRQTYLYIYSAHLLHRAYTLILPCHRPFPPRYTDSRP